MVAATRDVADVRVQLPVDARADLEAGLLTSEDIPHLRIAPKITLHPPEDGAAADYARVTVSGLFPFGDSTLPLLSGGREVATVRFHKAGLNLRPPAEGTFVARQRDGTLLLVLENASAFSYASVRGRLRFQDTDVCDLASDGANAHPAPTASVDGGRDCLDGSQWTSFAAAPSARVSLRSPLPSQWFLDPETGLARTAARQGTLTLRYTEGGNSGIFEQHLPLQVRFEPDNLSLTRSIGWVAVWLVFGALVSLLLRVSIPNYRRKKALKERLNELRVAIAELSDHVDSQLRVLLRVDRLTLERRCHEGWVLGPGFDDVAVRVEAGIAALKRKIDMVQRLDGIASRREALLEGPACPTRVDIIARSVAAVGEALKSDQLNDADWLFVQQRLEAAEKALAEQSPEEKQAFEALLSQRWKSIHDHFGQDASTGELQVPHTLATMKDCFPDGELLPKSSDVDGMAWIASIGTIRADLQLTALEIVRDVQFLAPVLAQNQKWSAAVTSLTEWLATPAIVNLACARRKLLQLAEGVDESDVVAAITQEQAQIELDPQIVSPNQTVRMTVRFRDARLNGASARSAVECEWRFHEPTMAKLWRASRRLADQEEAGAEPPAPAGEAAAPNPPVTECGWRVHRYFQPGIVQQTVEATFFWKGQPITEDGRKPVTLTRRIKICQRNPHANDIWERTLWRPLPQALQLVAALLVPLAALAVTTTGEGASSRWWELVSLGFGSETIRSILTGPATPPTT